MDSAAAAAAHLYWEAVQDLLAGDQGAAHAALRALGCRFALAPGVWARCRAGAHPGSAAAAPKTADPGAAPSTGGSLATAQPWLHDGVLPPVLAARLQAAFAPGAAYWREHAYADPGTPFFSYLFRLPGMTGGDSSGTGASDGGGDGGRPSTLLEAAAALCAQSAVDQASRGGGDASDGGGPAPLPPAALLQGATHVEFWAHTRPLDAPHQLHFDVNEGLLRRGRAAFRLLHPAASSVLFLTGAGGPTLVLAQTPQGACSGGAWPPTQAGGAAAGSGDVAGCSGAGSASGGPAQAAEPVGAGELWAPLSDSAALHLAPCGWLLRPSPARTALWPGNLAHCVLPGALTADAQAAEAACEAPELEPQPAAAGGPVTAATGGAGNCPPQQQRLTLILAWWRGDPRAELRADDGKCSGEGDSGGVEGPSSSGRLGALMPLPSLCERAPAGWLQDISLEEGEWDMYLAQARAAWSSGGASAEQAAGVGGGASCGGGGKSSGWRAADECVKPCWVQLGGGDGSGTADVPCAVAQAVPLPPLRFFLPTADAISAAYGQVHC